MTGATYLFADDGDGRPTETVIAEYHRASPAAVERVLEAPLTGDGRSEWRWIRLANGDLILGVFPHGETYFAIEIDAETPR